MLDRRRLAVKGEDCHNMGKKWSWAANLSEQFGNTFISNNMQRDPGGVWALCKDERRRFEDLGNHFVSRPAHEENLPETA